MRRCNGLTRSAEERPGELEGLKLATSRRVLPCLDLLVFLLALPWAPCQSITPPYVRRCKKFWARMPIRTVAIHMVLDLI